MTKKKNSRFNKSKYDQQYQKDHVKRIVISLNRERDLDLIDHLEPIQNVSGYVKRLIRKDMESDPDHKE